VTTLEPLPPPKEEASAAPRFDQGEGCTGVAVGAAAGVGVLDEAGALGAGVPEALGGAGVAVLPACAGVAVPVGAALTAIAVPGS
jgi:hypothetical protein